MMARNRKRHPMIGKKFGLRRHIWIPAGQKSMLRAPALWCGCTHRNGLWWLSINVRQPYGIGAESSGNACRSHTLSKRAGGI